MDWKDISRSAGSFKENYSDKWPFWRKLMAQQMKFTSQLNWSSVSNKDAKIALLPQRLLLSCFMN